jgi:hypothetical protein
MTATDTRTPWGGLPDYVEASVHCARPGCGAEYRRILVDRGSNAELMQRIADGAEAAGWEIEPNLGLSDRLHIDAWDYCPRHTTHRAVRT